LVSFSALRRALTSLSSGWVMVYSARQARSEVVGTAGVGVEATGVGGRDGWVRGCRNCRIGATGCVAGDEVGREIVLAVRLAG
jgi:hypothetical protein